MEPEEERPEEERPEEERIRAAAAADIGDPRNAAQLLHAAELCLGRNDLPRAEHFARAATLAPHPAEALRVLSNILWRAARPDAAVEAACDAVRHAPAAAAFRLHLGGLLLSRHQWREAAHQLAACVELDPAHPAAWRQLSAALQEMGRTPRALEAIARALALTPGCIDYQLHHGSLLAASGRYGDALAILTEAAAAAPADAAIWRALSGVHEALNDPAQARTTAQRAAALEPANPHYAAHLAQLHGEPAAAPTLARTTYWTERARPARRPPAPRPTAAGLLRIQARIVFALMLREMRTRFARSRLGYVWAILEPLSHIATLGSVFALLNRAPPPVGDHLFEFYLTGLLPFLLFSHVTNEVMTGFAANAPILQIPLIKRFDVIAARAVLSLATELMVGILVFGAAALIGWQALPADLLTCVAAILALWLLATGIGAFNLVAVELFPAYETIFAILVRLLYFASGIYYSPIAMPGPIRDALVYNPILQAVEWFRSGFYAGYQPHWLDRSYVILWALAALLTGLTAERALRRRLMLAA